jgi:hypothetical protein
MRLVITALLLLLGIIFLLLGTSFLFDPVNMGGKFGLAAPGAQGLATIRGDMTAIFWVTGICMIWGAWKRNGDPLVASALLMGIVFLGRCVSAALDGTYEAWFMPMAVEALTVALCLAGWKLLPHHDLREEG